MPTRHDAYMRHACHYLAFSEQAAPHLNTADQDDWQLRLSANYENITNALQWLLDNQEVVLSLRLCAALRLFWTNTSRFIEGERYLQRALAPAESDFYPHPRMTALTAAGALAWHRSEFETARDYHRQSLALATAHGNQQDIGVAVHNLGMIAWRSGEYGEAQELLLRSLEIDRESGNRSGVCTSLLNLGAIAHEQEHYLDALPCLEEGLALSKQIGDKAQIAMFLNNLGNVYLSLGEQEAEREQKQAFLLRAETLYLESLAIKRRQNNSAGAAATLQNLGLVACRQVQTERARTYLAESLATRRTLGDKLSVIETLAGFAQLATLLQQYERATRLFGATEILREQIGSPLPPDERAEHEKHIALARESFNNEQAFTAAWNQGRAMTMEQAINEAAAI